MGAGRAEPLLPPLTLTTGVIDTSREYHGITYYYTNTLVHGDT